MKVLKKVIHFLHLWLGLFSGVVILMVALTGAIYSFAPEIQNVTQHYRFVQQGGNAFLPVSVLKKEAERALDNKLVNSLILKDKSHAAIATSFSFKNDKLEYYYSVFINPYTGKVLHVQNMERDFFTLVIIGHTSLWLPVAVGSTIVRVATLIFLVIIITGIILWWPSSKARRKSSFKIKLKTSPKRLNYDLHNVLGFYASWIILFAVLTGLVWSFEWFGNSIYWISSGGQKKPTFPNPVTAIVKTANKIKVADSLFAATQANHPDQKQYTVNFPQQDSAALNIGINPSNETFYQTDYLYFNQYTGKEIPVHFYGKYSTSSRAEKLLKMNYDIHTGAVAGLFGRLLMFFAALVVASLPVTGFYIWWGKKGKAKTKQKKLRFSIKYPIIK